MGIIARIVLVLVAGMLAKRSFPGKSPGIVITGLLSGRPGHHRASR
jgi:hypothetical protein